MVDDQTAELEERLGALTEWLNSIELDQLIEIKAHLKKLDQSVGIGHTVVEVAIAKLEPGPDDVVIFWLPAELTHAQVRSVGDSFRAVIGGRFRFLVLIRQSVEIEIIGGKISKGGVILPS